MPAKIIPPGTHFGKLVVIGPGKNKKASNGRNASVSVCSCACGNTIEVANCSLRIGNTQSCGCTRREKTVQRNLTHGMSHLKLYRVWRGMISRCTLPSATGWCNYGARGITVCDRWKTFENFYADMGEPPPGHDLDRIDNNGNYEPSNCRWVTRLMNNRNSRHNRMILFRGEVLPLSQLAERAGISYSAARRRLNRGWTPERALTTPVKRPLSKAA